MLLLVHQHVAKVTSQDIFERNSFILIFWNLKGYFNIFQDRDIVNAT